MSADISGIGFGNLTFKSSVKVTNWGDTSTGERNDCYWNIAKNVAGEGASNAEIEEIMTEIAEAQSNQTSAQEELDKALQTGSEVMIPFKVQIETLTNAVGEAISSRDMLASQLDGANNALEIANSNLQPCLSEYLELKKQDNPNQNDLNTAYNAYKLALQEVQNAKEEVAKIQEQIEATDESIQDLRASIDNTQEKASQTEDEYKQMTEKLIGELNRYSNAIDAKQEALDKAREELQKSNDSINDAANANVLTRTGGEIAKNEDGNIKFAEENKVSADALNTGKNDINPSVKLDGNKMNYGDKEYTILPETLKENEDKTITAADTDGNLITISTSEDSSTVVRTKEKEDGTSQIVSKDIFDENNVLVYSQDSSGITVKYKDNSGNEKTEKILTNSDGSYQNYAKTPEFYNAMFNSLEKNSNDKGAELILQNLDFADLIQSTLRFDQETNYLQRYLRIQNNNESFPGDEVASEEEFNVYMTPYASNGARSAVEQFNLANLLKDCIPEDSSEEKMSREDAIKILRKAGISDVNKLVDEFRKLNDSQQEKYLATLEYICTDKSKTNIVTV